MDKGGGSIFRGMLGKGLCKLRQHSLVSFPSGEDTLIIDRRKGKGESSRRLFFPCTFVSVYCNRQ